MTCTLLPWGSVDHTQQTLFTLSRLISPSVHLHFPDLSPGTIHTLHCKPMSFLHRKCFVCCCLNRSPLMSRHFCILGAQSLLIFFPFVMVYLSDSSATCSTKGASLLQALLPVYSPWHFFLFALMVLVQILWFLFMTFNFMTQIYVSNISHSGLSPQAHIYSSHCLLDIIKQMVTVTENQHVQNQHIISPVSLQLATTPQTYSLFFSASG